MPLCAVPCRNRRAGVSRGDVEGDGGRGRCERLRDARGGGNNLRGPAIFKGLGGGVRCKAGRRVDRSDSRVGATIHLARLGKPPSTQSLAFPRIGLERDGVAVAADGVPAEVVRATALYADFILSGGESPGGVLDLGSIRGMRIAAQDALPGLVLVALPASWVRSHVGSTVGAVSF